MKKLLFLFILLSTTTLLAGQAIGGIILSLNPGNTEIWEAIYGTDTAYFDLNISGLTAGGPDSLGAFELDITFNYNVLTFQSIQFGEFLGYPHPYSFETDFYVDTSTPGIVHLDQVSFLFEWELNALQGDSFTLATLGLRGIDLGGSVIGLSNVVLSDAFGMVLFDPMITDAKINVVQIPEPTNFSLGFALLGMFGIVIVLQRWKWA